MIADFLLTPASLNFLVQAMLLVFIVAHLLNVHRKSNAAVWLTLFFAAAFVTSALSFLFASSLRWSNYIFPLVYGALFLALLFLLQFAYRYPFHFRKFESGVVLVLSSAAVVIGAVVSVDWIWSQGQAALIFEPPVLIQLLATAEGLWVVIVLLRQVRGALAERESDDVGVVDLIASRKMALALAVTLASFLLGRAWLALGDAGWGSLFLALAPLWALYIFSFISLDHLLERTTLLVKFSGIALLTMLTAISLSAWIAVSSQLGRYEVAHPFPNNQTFHFERVDHAFLVTKSTLKFEENLGEVIEASGGVEGVRHELGFTFPFAGHDWTEIWVRANGAVIFSEESLDNFTQLLDNQTAAIVPFLADLSPMPEGGIFASRQPDRYVITWQRMAPRLQPDSPLTVQLVLYADGSFDFNYRELPLESARDPYFGMSMVQMAGFIPGPDSLLLESFHFSQELPYLTKPDTGLIAGFVLDFRQFLHELVLPQVYLLVLAGLLTLAGSQFFFRVYLIDLLERLIQSVERMLNGDQKITLPAAGKDEPGRLIGLVNRLTQLVYQQQGRLQRLKTELEANLDEINAQLTMEVVRRQKIEKIEQRQRTALENLSKSGLALSTILDYNQALEQVLMLLARVIPYDAAEILLLKDQTVKPLYFRRSSGSSPPKSITPTQASFKVESDTRFNRMLVSRQPLAIEDTAVYTEPALPFGAVRSWLGAPLIYQGQVIAFLSLGAIEPGVYSADHTSYLAVFASQAALALENARLFAETQQLTITDALTGLANRHYFMEAARTELERARRYQRPIAVIRLDIDRFQNVSDAYGHLVGGQVLQAVAKCILDNLRKHDLAGRFNEGEFAILLPETERMEAGRVAERIGKTIAAMPVFTDEGDVSVTASAGVVSIGGDYPEEVEFLLSQAEQALQIAKRGGASQVYLWGDEPLPAH